MRIVCSAHDIERWIRDRNPCNALDEIERLGGDEAARLERLVDAFRRAPGRPAWEDDWEPWLAAASDRIVLAWAAAEPL